MTLIKKDYPHLGEVVYSKTLENGLEVILLPKAGYLETVGAMATRFGALDTVFKPKNRKLVRQFPAGIAHFLEHKLFELPEERDITLDFATIGSEVNAFTSYNQTVYYFSTTSQPSSALKLLQRLTSRMSVTEDSVAREKTIIAQEIKMYQDDADYRLYMSILHQLYPETPLAEDIAGSIASIDQISPRELEMTFDIFYQPSNMVLFLMGDFDPEILITDIETFQKTGRPRKKQPIIKQPMALKPILPSASIEFQVAGPKLAVGLRGQSKFTDLSTFKYRLCVKLLIAMVLGWTSSTYQDWYDKGKIDDSFQIEIEVTKNYQFLILTMDTSEPLAMSERIRRLLSHCDTSEDLNDDHLSLVKREMYGDFLKSMNHLEYTALHYINAWVEEEDLFELPKILETISLEDIRYVGRDFITAAEMTDFIIFPQ